MPRVALLVEDQNPDSFQAFIEAYNGFDFIIVKRGDHVLNKYKEVSPDVILMDVRLPYMTGIAATKKIRELDLTVPIIIMTAYGDKGTRERAMAAGANAFYVKPFSWRIVHQKMIEFCLKREQEGNGDPIKDKHRQELIKNKCRRVLALKEKKAYWGLECPTSILLEIEDLEREIEAIQRGNNEQ